MGSLQYNLLQVGYFFCH